jgi:subtilase family serine protease
MKKLTLCCFTLVLLFAFAPRAQAQLPDLQVSGLAVTAPATLTCGGQTVTFNVTETNAGPILSDTYHIDLLRSVAGSGFTPVCRLSRPAIRATRTRTVQLTCSFYNGPCDCLPSSYTTTFQAQIDSLNAVTESDETNNLSNLTAVASTCP